MEQLAWQENGQLSLGEVVIDHGIYPRSEWSAATVDRYAEAIEAGDSLPPLVLEQGTNRLLDGMHRYQAHKKLGSDFVEADYHSVPIGVPEKLYAASLSVRHGDRIVSKDLQDVARGTIVANPEFSMKTVAQMLGVTRQTVARWVGDITERRREVRKIKATLLSRAGRSNYQIADYLGVAESSVRNDVSDNISAHLTEDLLREALEALPDENGELAQAAEDIREDRIFASWSDEERALLGRLRAGEAVVVNMRGDAHPNLVGWAEDAGLFVKIDRRSEWGNPFELGKDGDRDEVIENYEEHYLPHKPSLLSGLGLLRGKALGCWCAPERCHGDVLKARAEG